MKSPHIGYLVLGIILFMGASCDRFQKNPATELKQIVGLYQNDPLNKGNSNCSFDVRKTDSLVSPYTGIVTYSTPRTKTADDEWEVSFAYQEKKWVLKGIRSRILFKSGQDETVDSWDVYTFQGLPDFEKASPPGRWRSALTKFYD